MPINTRTPTVRAYGIIRTNLESNSYTPCKRIPIASPKPKNALAPKTDCRKSFLFKIYLLKINVQIYILCV